MQTTLHLDEQLRSQECTCVLSNMRDEDETQILTTRQMSNSMQVAEKQNNTYEGDKYLC